MTKTIYASRRALLLSAGALLPLALTGCGGGETANTSDNGSSTSGSSTSTTTGTDNSSTATATTTTSSGGKLNGAGSTFINPLMQSWAASYTGAKINYQSNGSGAGIKALQDQTVDFAASDAPAKDADRKKMTGDIVQLPVTAGAVAVVYNLPGAPQNLKLDGATLANIFAGTVKTWNDPAIKKLNTGATLPATPIRVAHRSDGSGTTNILTTYLSAVSPSWKSSVGAGKTVAWPVGQGGKGNDGVAGIVKGQPGGIGYVELAYAKTKNPIPYASLKNAAGSFVEPSSDSAAAAVGGASAALAKDITTPIVNSSAPQAYPIVGFTYIIAPKGAGKGKQIADFLTYAIGDGQKAASGLNYAPLSPAVVKLDQALIATMGK